MDKLISLFTNQWPRKLIALAAALVVWLFVDQSITDTAVIPNVPIQVINLPDDKTISGIQPNGILSKRINLTLSGTKNVIQSIGPGDLIVQVNAAAANDDQWILHLTRKNLVSLNPSIDLSHHITNVRNPDYIIKLSKLAKAIIPIKINARGTPPAGYEFLDFWPRQLYLTFVGPEEETSKLANDGLSLDLDMMLISKSDLDKIVNAKENLHDDEISYTVPINWKKITHPLLGNSPVEINDPDAHLLHIDFLRKRFLPIKKETAIRVFYPLGSLDVINPLSYPLIENDAIKKFNDIYSLFYPLYAQNVSSLFLDVVRDNLEIAILAQAGKDGEHLDWSLNVVDAQQLEDRYVSYLISTYTRTDEANLKAREYHLRTRFRKYLRKLTLFRETEQLFQLDARLTKDGIIAIPVDSKY